jgi:3-isopropylmalate dehydrogenase
VERVIRDAFVRATRRRNKITLVHKHNVLVNAGGLWNRTFTAVAADYPEVATDYLHVDAATIFLVTDPGRFDVIVTDNLFGDILTDLAAAVTGGIGLAASGNINPDRRFPSMFEPVHGSAPDIAGQGIADPTATILSVALLLDHCGLSDEAARIERAVIADIAARTSGQSRTTSEIGDAIVCCGLIASLAKLARHGSAGGIQPKLMSPALCARAWRIAGTTECSLRARRRGDRRTPDADDRLRPSMRLDTCRT